ncbi:hypothetical protein MRB53_035800 [Persea americana]|uniref:Uncharacterized protein n=1 Tax=Persea americana TaxID=3435 RepID=A0ACC2K5Z1_PERAE|nr:hypothetical protein MRB53_035800 [Persea americana]
MGHLKISMSWQHTYFNTSNESMEMTTPVYTRKTEYDGEKKEMTTPVITKQVAIGTILDFQNTASPSEQASK